MKLFGFEFKRAKEDAKKEKLVSFVPPTNDDGALVATEGGVYGTYVDLDGSVRTEAELVNKYRTLSMDPIIDLAIQDIVNEAIVEDEDEPTVSILLDDIETSDGIKKKITTEFEELIKLTEFNRYSYEIFRRWYIDGRLYYHVMIDAKNPKKGIQEVRYIDPRHIKKIREIKKEKDKDTGVTIEKVKAEYYVYNPSGFVKRSGPTVTNAHGAEGVKIAKDSVAYCTSGYMSADGKLILSYLNKALRAHTQLRSMEDSLIIYRISRAPERRIFYVDVGGLPKAKAEQYLRDIMTKFKNKVVYDSTTGEIRDDRKFMTMLEDFWLPRRDGSRGTEISTLPGGQNLGEIEDIVYFQNILYRSLNVPVSRLQPDQTFTLGRATEITRDEVKFSKFITRLRNKFSELFLKLLEKQLLLKQICTVEDWEIWKSQIEFKYAIDNYYAELKNMEILRDRVNLLRDMEEYVGKYYSHENARRYVLQQTDEEIKENDEQIKKEAKDPRWQEFPDEDGEGGGQTTFPGGRPSEPAPPHTPATPPEPKPEPEEKKELKKEDTDDVTAAQIELMETMRRFLDDED